MRPRDESAIRDVEAAYDLAWNAGDATSAARLFTTGAVIFNPSGDVSEGREAIEHSLRELLEGQGKGSTHRSDLLGIRLVTDDVAIVDGEAFIDGFAGEAKTLQHRFTDLLVHGEEGWRIAQVRAYFFDLAGDARTLRPP